MSDYIHGTDSEEQARLSLLNKMTNDSFICKKHFFISCV
jgi:hypothetical protein